MAARGTRPVRIANCSGSITDPGYQMHRQAELGPIDFITGDYIAEANLAWNASSYRAGQHPGYEPTAKDGLWRTLPVLHDKRIKVIINGGSLNPRGLAEEVDQEIKKQGYKLLVAWVEGDDLMSQLPELIKSDALVHLDSGNKAVKLHPNAMGFRTKPVVSANAYLGARGIVKALDHGADIVICGRVADASPVIAAAQWWWGWKESQYDELAGALLAGHLIECSAYSTGGNFAGFDRYPVEIFLDIPFPIAEIERNGEVVVTKHGNTNGLVNADTVKCQFLYELQGTEYLNSDVKAEMKDIVVEEVGKDRVRVSGVKGYPPPPTTKLAVFYHGGFQSEFVINATGYATKEKYDLVEAQVKHRLQQMEILEYFDVLDFQRVGVPEENPQTQLRGTTYLRIFAQAPKSETLLGLIRGFYDVFMQHFPGMHGSLDTRTIFPKPYYAYYPALISQSLIQETTHLLRSPPISLPAHHPLVYAPLLPRANYPPTSPVPLSTFGHTVPRPLGSLVFARSGDKGANINLGLFIPSSTLEEWNWLRSFLTHDRMKSLMGGDWREGYVLERVEFAGIRAVHFVVYGVLGRGASSAAGLDVLGKGFAEFVRARWVDVPVRFLEGGNRGSRL
ncbi:DUF1446-domain-containing protein [Ascodesmis nigricans]|uniref:DUF1446-domain-containing protein n=1 Tax=Ascodesmis nigricans TaxID=341454 RepID=A0A4S2MSS4_9PEZI|nr:DUF1446-domain-containing protein [Ascodesmis nigricans]